MHGQNHIKLNFFLLIVTKFVEIIFQKETIHDTTTNHFSKRDNS